MPSVVGRRDIGLSGALPRFLFFPGLIGVDDRHDDEDQDLSDDE
jgi:hypothetical protein